MKISKEITLTNYHFWSSAKDHLFTYSELKEIESQLEELYFDGCEETYINYLFWFEEEFLCEWTGVDFNENYLNRN
jgi:hypothetical protein